MKIFTLTVTTRDEPRRPRPVPPVTSRAVARLIAGLALGDTITLRRVR